MLEQLLEQWIHKRTATKAALQSLVGKLIFISKCVRQSRIFIARILILLRKVLFNHHHVNLTAEFRKDIAWWRRFLRAYNGVSMISTAQWSSLLSFRFGSVSLPCLLLFGPISLF